VIASQPLGGVVAEAVEQLRGAHQVREQHVTVPISVHLDD